MQDQQEFKRGTAFIIDPESNEIIPEEQFLSGQDDKQDINDNPFNASTEEPN